MNCTNCNAEWTPPKNVSITQCPFCGKPLFEIKGSEKNAEPHEILLKIVHQYDRKKLGDILLKGMLSDLMPHVEKKYQRIFKQALDDRIGAKLLDLDDEKTSIRIVKISTLKNSFRNNNGFDQTADYVVDCFLFALGWIETLNKEEYSQIGINNLSIISQQIDMAFIDGALHSEESKAIFSNSQKLGLDDKVIVDLINAKIKSLKLKPYPPILKSIKSQKEIICSSNWHSKSVSISVQTKKISDTPKKKEISPLNKQKTIVNQKNSFTKVKIGNQNWMVKNLEISKFRNGDRIPRIQSPEEWKKYGEEKKPACCYYEDNYKNNTLYGKLYNWWAVIDVRGLAPDGWHIPTNNEWNELEKFCVKNVGTKLKSKNGWPGHKGNDDYGFSALPGGYRNKYGKFDALGNEGYFWTCVEVSKADARAFKIWRYLSGVSQTFGNKTFGFSIRCLKD